MKPVASGCRDSAQGMRNEDAEELMRASNVHAPYVDVNPYAFSPPISPHIAAHEAGVEISPATVQRHFAALAAQADHVIVEGAGGWLAPIGEQLTMADIARTLGLPIVLVVGMRLGCLNHALLTQRAIAASGLPLAGWVASCVAPDMDRLQQNLDVLTRRLEAPCWAVLPYAPQGVTPSIVGQLRDAAIPE